MTAVFAAILWACAALAAGTLTVPEVLKRGDRSRLYRGSYWLGVTLLRTAAVGLLLVGLLELLGECSRLIYFHLDQCLWRAGPRQTPPTLEWTRGWLRLAVGLGLCVIALPPATAAAAAWVLLFAAVSSLWLCRAALPLSPAAAWQLTGLAVAVAIPAAAVGAAGAWLARSAEPKLDGARAMRRMGGGLALVLLATALLAPWWLTSRSGPLPPLVLIAAMAAALLAVLRQGLPAMPELDGGGAVHGLRRLAIGLCLHRRAAWLVLGCLLCVAHLAIAGLATQAVLRDGQRLLERIARQPELVCFRPDPTPADWQAAAGQMERIGTDYAGHPYCGQWLLIEAWIESTRLHNPFRAWLLLRRVEAEYAGAPACAPVGWLGGRTADRVATEMLRRLAPLGPADAPVS